MPNTFSDTRLKFGSLRTRLAALRNTHVLLGAGCSCGMPADHINTADIESMIFTHLKQRYRSRSSVLFELLEADRTLGDAITAILEGSVGLSDEDAGQLQKDIETSLASFEELSGTRSGFRPRFREL